ncbi:MAG TPA: hypothetical protein VG817_11225 [Gemmatimonadales bacterium]|nr:hypothetical protein [Gemmatimonadales bacterium]
MSIVSHLATAVAPWADFYNASPVAQTVVTFGHFGGMMTAGGLALATDRATLRSMRGEAWEHRRHLRELAAIHPLILGALAVTSVSGLLMFAADVEALATAPVFWVKMGLVLLLLGNGWVMLKAERQLALVHPSDATGWRQLRRASLVSLGLWFAVVLAGSILPILA